MGGNHSNTLILYGFYRGNDSYYLKIDGAVVKFIFFI